MAPFPTRRNPVSSSLLPTIHSPSQSSLASSSSSASSPHSYPPLPPSTSTTPSHSPVGSRAPSFSYPRHEGGETGAQSFARKQQVLDPHALFGGMAHPSQGSLKGLAGHSWESKEAVRRCLEVSHGRLCRVRRDNRSRTGARTGASFGSRVGESHASSRHAPFAATLFVRSHKKRQFRATSWARSTRATGDRSRKRLRGRHLDENTIFRAPVATTQTNLLFDWGTCCRAAGARRAEQTTPSEFRIYES